MDAEKITTLEQVHDAIDIVENARAIAGLMPPERMALEIAVVKLRNLERTIIRIKTKALISTLTTDADTLKDLASQMRQSAEKLAGVSHAIEKAAGAVEDFIKIAATVLATGLL